MDKDQIIPPIFSPVKKELDLNTDVIIYKDCFLIPQITVTTKDDLDQMARSPYGDLANTLDLGGFRGGISVDSVWDTPDQKEITYTYIAPAFSFLVIDKLPDGSIASSKGIYITKGHPIGLAMDFFPLFLAGITNRESKYYNKDTLNIVYNKLNNLAERAYLGDNERNMFTSLTDLKYIYLKEFIVAYFSAKVSPNNFYSWPNAGNKNSAINDFFESFYLNNLNAMDISLDEIEYENSYYVPTKRSNLVFLPISWYIAKEDIVKTPSKSVCIPLIYDSENSYKISFQYKIPSDMSFGIETISSWNFVEIERYLPDSELYLMNHNILNKLEKVIDFNYNVSDVKFAKVKDVKNIVPSLTKYTGNENNFIIPGLKIGTTQEILYYCTQRINFITDPTNVNNMYYKTLKNFETSVDISFTHRNNLLLLLETLKTRTCENQNYVIMVNYIIKYALMNLTAGLLQQPLVHDTSIYEHFPDIGKTSPYNKRIIVNKNIT